MVPALLDVAAHIASADPTCIPCTRTGGGLALIIAALVSGGWLAGEALGALRARRIRRIAESSDTP